jgi:HEAT repeat protein
VAQLAARRLDRKAVKTFRRALKDPQWLVRRAGLLELARFNDPAFLPLLVEHCKDPHAAVREAAIIGIVTQRNTEIAFMALPPMLRDANSIVRWHAAKGLLTLRWKPDSDFNSALLYASLGQYEALETFPEHAVDALILSYQGSFPHQRQAIVELLGRFENPRAVPFLIEALKDEAYQVRMESVESLGRLKKPELVPHIVSALKDSSSAVRCSAIHVLGKRDDPTLIPALAGALSDENWEARIAAVNALGRFRLPEVIPHLLPALQDKELEVVQTAIKALGRLRAEPAILPLVLLLKHSASATREAALNALNAINPDWLRDPVCRKAIPELLKGLNDEEYWVRYSSSQVLRQICSEEEVKTYLAELEARSAGGPTMLG